MHLAPGQGSSASALPTFGRENSSRREAVLCIVGYLNSIPGFYPLPASSSSASSVIIKNVCRHFGMSPGRQNHCRLSTRTLDHLGTEDGGGDAETIPRIPEAAMLSPEAGKSQDAITGEFRDPAPPPYPPWTIQQSRRPRVMENKGKQKLQFREVWVIAPFYR